MAGLQIEGDCAQINDKQLEFIRNVIEKMGFKNNKVIIEPLGKVGDNYMANVRRIAVENKNGGTFKIVIKLAPQHEMERKFGNIESAFRNEHILYTKLLPKYTKLEEIHNVSTQDRLRYPICYGSSDDAPNEVILLEDLNECNFKMLDRFEPLNYDCVRSIIRNFALLHSLGFALKHKEPKVFDEYKNSLSDMFSNIDDVEQAADLFKSMESNIISLFESDHYKKVIQEAITGSFHELWKISKSDVDSKLSIIQHGDAWSNNFLFKFDDTYTVSQSILIDYQIAKAANPVTDLLFMISACTDYESRNEHYYDWIDYYHSELDKALSNYGLNSNFVYPRHQLDLDLKRYGKALFGQTIFMISIIALKPEEAATMKEAMVRADMEAMVNQSGAANSNDPVTVTMFKEKIEGLVDSYFEFGLL